jgi:hypothetical protein
VLLAEVDNAVRLDAHAETGPDRHVLCERFLTGRTRGSVIAATSEHEERDSTSGEQPITLDNNSSRVLNGRREGQKQAVANISNHSKTRHPMARMDWPCSSSFGGANLTVPGALGETPVRGSVSTPPRTSDTVRTNPQGTPAT